MKEDKLGQEVSLYTLILYSHVVNFKIIDSKAHLYYILSLHIYSFKLSA